MVFSILCIFLETQRERGGQSPFPARMLRWSVMFFYFGVGIFFSLYTRRALIHIFGAVRMYSFSTGGIFFLFFFFCSSRVPSPSNLTQTKAVVLQFHLLSSLKAIHISGLAFFFHVHFHFHAPSSLVISPKATNRATARFPTTPTTSPLSHGNSPRFPRRSDGRPVRPRE